MTLNWEAEGDRSVFQDAFSRRSCYFIHCFSILQYFVLELVHAYFAHVWYWKVIFYEKVFYNHSEIMDWFQNEAVEIVQMLHNLVILGQAGSGKIFVVK
jgi:hypothetical protein